MEEFGYHIRVLEIWKDVQADPDSVLKRIEKAVKVLGGKIPKPNNDCDFCKYREAVSQFEK